MTVETNPEVTVTLRFFASVREQLGRSEETLTLPSELTTVGQVRDWLIARGAPWAAALASERPLRMAYQQVLCEPSQPLLRSEPTQEIAFFPPVTGG